MMTRSEVATASLDQLTDELAAAGWDSTQQTVQEAREAVLRLLDEFAGRLKISEIKGASVFRGTVCLDGDGWTLECAASAEAYSRQESSNSQTTVNPSNGVWVSWEASHDTAAKAEYERLLAECMEAERSKEYLVVRSTAPCSGLDSAGRPFWVCEDDCVPPNHEVVGHASSLDAANSLADKINAALPPECPE